MPLYQRQKYLKLMSSCLCLALLVNQLIKEMSRETQERRERVG